MLYNNLGNNKFVIKIGRLFNKIFIMTLLFFHKYFSFSTRIFSAAIFKMFSQPKFSELKNGIYERQK